MRVPPIDPDLSPSFGGAVEQPSTTTYEDAHPPLPLAVDLDGSLVRTDTLHELAFSSLRTHPLAVFQWPVWLMTGKATLKRELATRAELDARSLPYNVELISWLIAQKKAGRRLILCTGADERVALAVADHLGIFDEVIASNCNLNLCGIDKRAALEARFGSKGFDYVGNSSADLDVWRGANRAIVVSSSKSLRERASRIATVAKVFKNDADPAAAWRALRAHQWLKNLLLFVPATAAHQLGDLDVLWHALLAFISFSLCASGVYIFNDLLDIESDRAHPRKKTRPFASGSVKVWVGALMSALLLSASVLLGLLIAPHFISWLCLYVLLTLAYSFQLKKMLLVDCVVLALFYTIRVVAGGAATDILLSFWLIAFCVFLFLSLAFVKRFVELKDMASKGELHCRGRGYAAQDAQVLQTIGIASGYASVVILALYLQSEAVVASYARPEFMWGAVLMMMFWVTWIWLKANRGDVDDDPVVFAASDRTSLFVGLLFILCFVLAKVM